MENKHLCNIKSCTGCGDCAQVCPKKCINMKENSEGFWYPVTDMTACINCGMCGKVCHVLGTPEKHSGKFYMCWNKNAEIIAKSSSGGVFTALAKMIFDKGGVVFGAFQDFQKRRVYHIEVERYEDLDKVRLSKYCQSDLRNVCHNIKERLLAKQPVLFCGTACQTAAVLRFISNSPAKQQLSLLYTVDVLCHGVASQKTVDAFLKSKEKQFHKKAEKYYFRVKTNGTGWNSGGGTRMRLIFQDGSEFVASLGSDTFFMGFNNNLFLRESCYECRYCGTERVSDFTIADYWGVPEDAVSAEQLQRGVSVMTVNTEKASLLLEPLTEIMEIQEIKPDIAVANNRSFQKPNERPAERDEYFRLLDTMDYDSIIKKLLHSTYIKGKIKGIIGVDNIRKVKKLLKRK